MTRVRTAPPPPTEGPASPVDGDHALLRSGGHDPDVLAELHGTPYFAYDLALVGRQVDALRGVLPDAFELAYAVKANPSLAVLEYLAELGIGADVASAGELGLALRAGFAPARIVITGPGKRDAELARAVEAGVRAITVESPGELRRLARIAEGHGRAQPVILRAAVASTARRGTARVIGDDAGGKFGMGVEDLHAAAREAVESRWLELLGVHAFGASNERDADVLADHVDATIGIGLELAATTGVRLAIVDVGGGLGVPYAAAEAGLDLARLGSRLAAASARLAASPGTRATRVIVEPGRFLVAAAGVYVTRVLDRKTIGRRVVVIVDGGIHHLLRGVLVGQEARVRPLARAAPEPGGDSGRPVSLDVDVEVAGPLCTGLDVLARDVRMPLPEPGDLVAVLDAGAYGSTESMPFFLSHPLPAEVALLEGRAWVARPRIEPEVWLGWQRARPADA